jgi:hypothetical protein
VFESDLSLDSEELEDLSCKWSLFDEIYTYEATMRKPQIFNPLSLLKRCNSEGLLFENLSKRKRMILREKEKDEELELLNKQANKKKHRNKVKQKIKELKALKNNSKYHMSRGGCSTPKHSVKIPILDINH